MGQELLTSPAPGYAPQALFVLSGEKVPVSLLGYQRELRELAEMSASVQLRPTLRR